MEFITRLICKLSVNLTSVGNLESISNQSQGSKVNTTSSMEMEGFLVLTSNDSSLIRTNFLF